MYFNGITPYFRTLDEMERGNWYDAMYWAYMTKRDGWSISIDTWESILRGVVMLDELGFVDDSPFSWFVNVNENADNIRMQMEV